MKTPFPAALGLIALAGACQAQSGSQAVCLRAIDVDHTKVPDERTILFYMRDGKTWSTTLKSACPELRFNGFAYDPSPPDVICANMQTIRVLKSGAICEIGPLIPVSR